MAVSQLYPAAPGRRVHGDCEDSALQYADGAVTCAHSYQDAHGANTRASFSASALHARQRSATTLRALTGSESCLLKRPSAVRKTSAVLELSRLAGGAVDSFPRPQTNLIQLSQTPHSMILQADQGCGIQSNRLPAQGLTQYQCHPQRPKTFHLRETV